MAAPMIFAGRGILLAIYLPAMAAATYYFLHIFRLGGYHFSDYFRYLAAEPIRWLPLIFIFVPASALLLDYSLPGFIAGIIYLCAIFIIYFPGRTKNHARRHSGRILRIAAVNYLLLLAIFVICILFAYMPSSSPLLYLASFTCAFLPFLTVLSALLSIPLEQAAQAKTVQRAIDTLKGRPDLTLIGIAGKRGQQQSIEALSAALSVSYDVLTVDETDEMESELAKAVCTKLEDRHRYLICPVSTEMIHGLSAICSLIVLDSRKFASLGKNPVFTEPVSFGTDEACAYSFRILGVTHQGTEAEVVFPEGDTETFHLKRIGARNTMATLGAAVLAYKLGVPMQKLKSALQELTSKPHLMEGRVVNEMTVIDDTANAVPEGVLDALESMQWFSGTKILMTAGITELGAIRGESARRFGAAASKVFDYIILVGKENTRAIRSGIMSAGFLPDRLMTAETTAAAWQLVKETQGSERIILLESDLAFGDHAENERKASE